MSQRRVPVGGKRRIERIDALRGFALIGVLLVNLRYFSFLEFLSPDALAALGTAGLDRAIELWTAAFVDTKSITVFTLLFGVGFSMQMERAAESRPAARRYLRRMLVLLGIGTIHAYLLWWGDILRIYAILGLFLLPLNRISTRKLAWIGVLVALLGTTLLLPLAGRLLPGAVPSAQADAAALAAFSQQQLSVAWRGNLTLDIWHNITSWSLWIFVLGRILVGVALGRSGALQDPSANRELWRRLLAIALPLGILCTALVIWRDYAAPASLPEWWKSPWSRFPLRLARSAGSLSLGLAYVGLFVAAYERPAWRRWLSVFAPVGRMALTNYVAQTILGIAVFYGVGLGVGPQFGQPGVLAAFLVFFAAQVGFSSWWLARFRFGPLEWGWRCLTYGEPQRFRR